MSLYSINNYYNELDKIIQYGGSKKETAIRNVVIAFQIIKNMWLIYCNVFARWVWKRWRWWKKWKRIILF